MISKVQLLAISRRIDQQAANKVPQLLAAESAGPVDPL
jgi:hypothetical protein